MPLAPLPIVPESLMQRGISQQNTLQQMQQRGQTARQLNALRQQQLTGLQQRLPGQLRSQSLANQLAQGTMQARLQQSHSAAVAAQLANQLSSQMLPFARPQARAKLDLARAKTAAAGLPTGLAKDMAVYNQMLAQRGADDPQVRAYASYLNKKVTRGRGISMTTPGGSTIQIGGGAPSQGQGAAPSPFFPTQTVAQQQAAAQAAAQQPAVTFDIGSEKRSRKGAGYTTTDPVTGKVTRVNVPTTTSVSQMFGRGAAAAEKAALFEPALKGLRPYQGNPEIHTALLGKDIISYLHSGDPTLRKKLTDYLRSMMLTKDMSVLAARMSGAGATSQKFIDDMENKMFPSNTLPYQTANRFMPQEIVADATAQMGDLLQAAQKNAQKYVRGGAAEVITPAKGAEKRIGIDQLKSMLKTAGKY